MSCGDYFDLRSLAPTSYRRIFDGRRRAGNSGKGEAAGQLRTRPQESEGHKTQNGEDRQNEYDEVWRMHNHYG